MEQNPSVFPSVVTTLLRVLGGVLGGWLIGKGWISAEQAPQIGGALLALGVAGWGVYSKFKANAALKNAIAAPAGLAEPLPRDESGKFTAAPK